MKEINHLDNLQSLTNENEYVLLKFHATWCQPCKNFAPIVDQVASNRNDVAFASVDIDVLPDLREELRVRSVPTLVLLKDGKEVNTLSGSTTASSVNQWIDQVVKV